MALRVLIAEDEWLLALAMRQQVESVGYEVVGVAKTGEAALELFRSAHPDVVLMDVRMPHMDGITATRILMEESPRPVVVVTGNPGYEVPASEAGAMVHVTKPLVTEQIPAIIETARLRFARFMVLREETGSCQEALAAWPLVQRAVRVLMEREHLPEQDAFERLQGMAAAGRTTLAAAAHAVECGA